MACLSDSFNSACVAVHCKRKEHATVLFAGVGTRQRYFFASSFLTASRIAFMASSSLVSPDVGAAGTPGAPLIAGSRVSLGAD